jgi:hypothetical protein
MKGRPASGPASVRSPSDAFAKLKARLDPDGRIALNQHIEPATDT